MKNIFVTLLILTFALNFNLQAQVKKYASGDSNFVWASSLNIRESPSPGAKIVGKVAYGSVVVIVDDEIGQVSDRYAAVQEIITTDTNHYVLEERRVDENTTISTPKYHIIKEVKPAFFIHGFWVKVNFDGTVGYVFDGYLSKIKTKSIGNDKFGLLESWAKHDLKLSPEKLIDKKTESAWTEYSATPDLMRIRIGHDAKTAFRQVKLKNVSFEEGCMLGFQLFEGNYLMESDINKMVFKSKDDNGDCEIWVTKKESWIVITLTCSC